MDAPRRILVLRGGALGDFIVTLPALALLRHRWPAAHIELVGNPTAAVLAVNRGLVDVVHAQHENRWAALYGVAPLPTDFATWLATFDVVLNYWPDPEDELAARFPLRTDQFFLTAKPLPALAPAAAHFCAPLRALGLEPSTFFHALVPAQPEPALVALHPGSGSPRKNWPLERWLALGRWLETECHCRVRVISGEAEPANLLRGVGRAWRFLPLETLAEELARCQLFVGHDSGISHLAAAAGARCVLLFGPTDPAMWAPPTSRVTVLQRGSELADLSLADVQVAVKAARQDQS